MPRSIDSRFASSIYVCNHGGLVGRAAEVNIECTDWHTGRQRCRVGSLINGVVWGSLVNGPDGFFGQATATCVVGSSEHAIRIYCSQGFRVPGQGDQSATHVAPLSASRCSRSVDSGLPDPLGVGGSFRSLNHEPP